MAYVPVPKDLSKVKTKVALNLTKRQIICFSLAGASGLPAYFLTKNYIGTNMAANLMVIIMLPFFFFAMYEKDGFPAEKILLQMLRQKVFYPGIRPYKTENMYARLEKQNQIEKEIRNLEKKAKSNVTNRHENAAFQKKHKKNSIHKHNQKGANQRGTKTSCRTDGKTRRK